MLARRQLGILLFDQVEVLDFCGPFEVFSVTRLVEGSHQEAPSPFQVSLISESGAPVLTTGGMQVLADFSFENCPELDILLVPGGWGTRQEMFNETLLDFVRTRAPRLEILASVCTGALILASAGLLDGLPATTHWKSLDLLQSRFPRVQVERQARVVKAGHIITSAGIAAGMDMALTLVADLHGETIARQTARHMEYPFPEDKHDRSAEAQ